MTGMCPCWLDIPTMNHEGYLQKHCFMNPHGRVIHLFQITAGTEGEGHCTFKYKSQSNLSLSARANTAQGAETFPTVPKACCARHLELATVI